MSVSTVALNGRLTDREQHRDAHQQMGVERQQPNSRTVILSGALVAAGGRMIPHHVGSVKSYSNHIHSRAGISTYCGEFARSFQF
jgi:hypothetical protein